MYASHTITALLDEVVVPTITIRNVNDELKRRLRIRAAEHGHSMEEEARSILRAALNRQPPIKGNLAAAIHARFAPLGGLDLDIPPREPAREPPTFD